MSTNLIDSDLNSHSKIKSLRTDPSNLGSFFEGIFALVVGGFFLAWYFTIVFVVIAFPFWLAYLIIF